MICVRLFLLLAFFCPELLATFGWPFFGFDSPGVIRIFRSPPAFSRGNKKHGHHGYHGHHEPHGHGHHGHHGHGHGHHFYDDSSEEDDDCYYDHKPISRPTKRPPTTHPTPLPTRVTTTTTEDISSLIDVRFKEERERRSTDKKSNILINNNEKNVEAKILKKRNFYYPTNDDYEYEGESKEANNFYPFWNNNYGYGFPRYSNRIANCAQRKAQCVKLSECKIASRQEHFYTLTNFCRYGYEEPYICCEKKHTKNNVEIVNKNKENNISMCGKIKSTVGILQAIIGGASVSSGGNGYPWMVAVGENLIGDQIDWYCGGALIGQKTVITAAHCVAKRKASVIRVGEIDLSVAKTEESSKMQEISVNKILIHPLFKSPLLYNDIALLYLDKPVELNNNVRTICLTQKTSISETPVALLTGWGQLGFANERSSVLQEVTIKVFNNSYCDQQYSVTQSSRRFFPRGILDTQLCAGDEEGGKDACQGDSGAPLVTEEDGDYVLFGLVSAGIGCGSQNFPGVYSRISAFTPWIRENIL